MDKVQFFLSGSYILSNFAPLAVEFDGKLWPTQEHAYQAGKFNDAELKERVRGCTSPMQAMKLTHGELKASVRSDWDDVKAGYMEELARLKYEQHEEVRVFLDQTSNQLIEEASPVDSFWGIGSDGKGANQMGKIWMQIRDENAN